MGNPKNKNLSSAAELRRHAEEQLRAKKAAVHRPLTGQAAQRLVHELEVHQIELEMQNAELKRSREELELSHTQYLDLYDFAPVGYVTIDARGLIEGVNLTGAHLLGIERRLLLKRSFISCIAEAADHEIFLKHRDALFQKQCGQTCEIRLKRKNDAAFWAELQSTALGNSDGKAGNIHTTIVDITERKKMEAALQKANDELEQQVQKRTAQLQAALAEIQAMKDRLEDENIYLRQEQKKRHQFDNIIGESDGLKYVMYRAEQVAPLDTTVLILGETGTGKELIAAAIHNMSPRKTRAMITVNCAGLPDNLIESELFGREKGAYTGADIKHTGRFEIADGSTICLDEIGELPLELQAKLLRVIQHSEFERLGSSQTIKVDVRILATTNRNLEEEVRAGRFRKDLFYRLNVFPITIPPLRQRTDDIEPMVETFIARYSKEIGKQITTIPKETMAMFQEYQWPGNVRELESIIERAIILCPGPALHLEGKLAGTPREPASQERTLEALERNQILNVLHETKWRIEGKDKAAAILGLHPSTLRARMHKLGIVRPGKR